MENKNILIVYNIYSSPVKLCSREINPGLNIGNRTTLFTADAGYDNAYPHIPYGIYPKVNSVRTNMPQQGTIVLFVKEIFPGATTGILQIVSTPDVILGVPELSINTRLINIRGVINKTKFNNMANLAIS